MAHPTTHKLGSAMHEGPGGAPAPASVRVWYARCRSLGTEMDEGLTSWLIRFSVRAGVFPKNARHLHPKSAKSWSRGLSVLLRHPRLLGIRKPLPIHHRTEHEQQL